MKRRLFISQAPIIRRPCPHRLYSTSTIAGAVQSPTTTTSSNNGETPSLKPRKWGNRALPLSPLMDPVKIEQRNRYKQPKLPPPKNADLTTFQKALVNNPYARALATDVRFCRITEARLPSFFQIPFETLPHPEPPHPLNIVPSRLFSKVTPHVAVKKRAAASYVQGRRSVLRFVVVGKRGAAFMNQNQREAMSANSRRNMTWRKDMDEVVLDLLQKAVVRSLRWGLQHPKAGLFTRHDEGASGLDNIDGTGCLLYKDTIKTFVELEARADKLVHECHYFHERVSSLEATGRRMRGKSQEHVYKRPPPILSVTHSHPPAPYPSARCRDRIVPVYSLMDMLGEEKMGELLKETSFEDARAIVVKEGNLTTNVQMALLRLQEYLQES